MAQTLRASVQIKRGTTAKRLAVTPLDGEFIFDTDLNELYIGDGLTPGGNLVTLELQDAYDTTTEYEIGTIVSHSGKVYVATSYVAPGAVPGVSSNWRCTDIESVLLDGSRKMTGNLETAGEVRADSHLVTQGFIFGENTDGSKKYEIGDLAFDGKLIIRNAQNGDLEFLLENDQRLTVKDQAGNWRKILDTNNGPTTEIPSAANSETGELYYDTTSQRQLIFDGTSWKLNSLNVINELSDVDTQTNPPKLDDLLAFNGTNWATVSKIDLGTF